MGWKDGEGKESGGIASFAPGGGRRRCFARPTSEPRLRALPDQVFLARRSRDSIFPAHHLPSPAHEKFLIKSSCRGAAEANPSTSGVGGRGVGGLGPVRRFSNFFGPCGTWLRREVP